MLQAAIDPTGPYDLYIALFARTSVPRTYHWALLVCPSNSPPTATTGVRYHVTNSIQAPTPETPNPPPPDPSGRIPWRFQAQPLATLFTASPLLARVLVSQVADPADAQVVLEAVPLIQDNKAWTCRVWARDALANLAQQGVINLPSQLSPSPIERTPSARLSLTDDAWAVVETACLTYLEKKHAVHRWRDASEGGGSKEKCRHGTCGRKGSSWPDQRQTGARSAAVLFCYSQLWSGRLKVILRV